jgi:hypothetical protein
MALGLGSPSSLGAKVGLWQLSGISTSQFPNELQQQVPVPKSDLPDRDWILISGLGISLEIGRSNYAGTHETPAQPPSAIPASSPAGKK